MTDITTAERVIREALAAGPTGGIWICYDNDPGTFQVATVERFGIYSAHSEDGFGGGTPEADSAFIARCNPANIAAILDELTRLRAENEALREDAERYRWLRGDGCRDYSARWMQWEVRFWRAPFWTDDLRHADLDAAIDATRKGEA